jgi:nodulation protein E
MEKRRVVITGMGVISALGQDCGQFRQSLQDGRSGIGPMELVDRTQFRFQNSAEVSRYSAGDHFENRRADLMDRFAQFAVIAAREAVRSAGVEWTPETSARTAIVTGTAYGGQESSDAAHCDIYLHQKRPNPMAIPRAMSNAGASHISMEFGITGPAYTVSTACSSSTHAIGQAFWMVRSGIAERAITGGSEAPLNWANLRAWEALRVVSADICRPFSKNRSGMSLGEGGAMLVLETLDSALSRGAPIFAEIVGFGMSADAHHLTQPNPEGAARAIRAALQDGCIYEGQIGYINAHGTATLANDSMETTAIRTVFGKQADTLPISSTKSLHGHSLGASGAMEAVATSLALYHGILPPTANFTEPDPQCDLDVIPNEARQTSVEYALSNSFAFGGLNAVLAFRRWDR